MTLAMELLFADLIFGPELDLENSEWVSTWLDRYALDPGDRATLEGGELKRLVVYRSLVRGRLKEALELQMPRLCALLGEQFEPWFGRFLAERGPRTQYLRDVAVEFLDFVAPHWEATPGLPPYWIELGRHEALHVEISALPVAARSWGEPAALSLEAGLQFCEAARLVRYRHAVHRWLDDGTQPEPEATPIALLAYRDAEHDARFLELSPLAATLVENLMNGLPLGAALTQALARHQVLLAEARPEIVHELLEQCSVLLADLSERGVILAASSTPTSSTPTSSAPPSSAPANSARYETGLPD
ncbi:MAG TPA: putative DNA-binding domain-containing protein [Polyangiaceae bacterium]|nr:putative DNA-binding domain-containing protein [Polyangiaceae bacterium]